MSHNEQWYVLIYTGFIPATSPTIFSVKFLPTTASIPLDDDGLLLDTVHWFSPTSLPVTASVWL